MQWKKLTEPTIWAIWWLVVGGAGLWVIVGSIGYFSRNGWLPNEAAGWAQAIGAGVAIIVASFIPMWHAKVATREKQRNLLGVMRVLSDEAMENLWLLTNNFIYPHKEQRMMREYLYNKREQDWPGLLDAINKIPISELPPGSAKILGSLRDAVAYGQAVSTDLPRWVDRSYSQPDVLIALRAKRDLLSLCRASLPHVDGVSVLGKVNAQSRGEPEELSRPVPEPYAIDGVKVFRRYVWDNGAAVVPIAVYIQCLFPYDKFECACEAFEAEGNWKTFEDAENFVIQKASTIIWNNYDWGVYFKTLLK
jgi:hypothetical protein